MLDTTYISLDLDVPTPNSDQSMFLCDGDELLVVYNLSIISTERLQLIPSICRIDADCRFVYSSWGLSAPSLLAINYCVLKEKERQKTILLVCSKEVFSG
jgi:hypothetical protein